MDVRLVKTFVVVARCASFSEAARELGYTQSAVSQQVAALERDLGVALLHRRPVALTSAGTRLLEHARPLLLRVEAARADVARLSAAPAGRVVLGVSPLAMTPVIADALAGAREDHPRTRFTLRVVGRTMVASQVSTGALDVGIADGVAAPNDPLHLADVGPLTAVGIHEEQVAVLLAATHPLRGRQRLHLADLADAQWIDAPDVTTTPTQLGHACGVQAFPASMRYDGTDARALVMLSAAGHGLTLLPWSVAKGAPGCTALLLASPRLVHRCEALHRHELAAPARALMTHLLSIAAPLTG